MHDKDWSLKTENNEKGTCVHVIINDDVKIEGLVFSLIDEQRHVITTIKVSSREIYMCTDLATPTFVMLGECVKYVDGSGYETYHLDKK